MLGIYPKVKKFFEITCQLAFQDLQVQTPTTAVIQTPTIPSEQLAMSPYQKYLVVANHNPMRY